MLGEALATEVWVPHMASYIFTPQERETIYFWAFTEKTNHHNKNSNAEVTISQTSQTPAGLQFTIDGYCHFLLWVSYRRASACKCHPIY